MVMGGRNEEIAFMADCVVRMRNGCMHEAMVNSRRGTQPIWCGRVPGRKHRYYYL